MIFAASTLRDVGCIANIRLSCLALVVILGFSTLSRAAGDAAGSEPWRGLPPTPDLPRATTSGYVPVNGARLYYASFGHGQPVLLLHGGLANSNYWGAVIPYLRRAGYRPIVIDSRGHGRSSRTDTPLSYDLMASDVLGVLDQLSLHSTDIVGWSDGGIIGLDLAMHHAERVHRLFTFGANSDTSGLYDDVATNPTFAAYIARTRKEYQQLSPTPDGYEGFLAQIQSMWEREPHYSAADLQSITVPTAIADGAHDEGVRREHTEYLAGTIPGATLVILKDVSHFGMIQNPKEFAAAVVAFLGKR